MFGTAILFAFTGETLLKKGLPRPHPKTFNNFGHGVIVYNYAEILLLLIVRTTEMRRLMGPCFPTGGWFLRGRLNLILFVQLIAYLHCHNSRRTHINQHRYAVHNCTAQENPRPENPVGDMRFVIFVSDHGDRKALLLSVGGLVLFAFAAVAALAGLAAITAVVTAAAVVASAALVVIVKLELIERVLVDVP
mgnify:CR=1 FL=1